MHDIDNQSLSPKSDVVLYQPAIAQNMGNIIRTCSVTGVNLSYVPPTGFSLQSKDFKRSGMDYHDDISLSCITYWEQWLDENQHRVFFFSSHATTSFFDVDLTGAALVFGSETSGLPNVIHNKYKNRFVTIPMRPDKRCLNLSNSVAIAIYESIRQTRCKVI
ncbi:tRNA (cytidine(34)-2'-O)-methyltransferase [Chlamydiia bacterium]|nr:tRNA (cytidine(34)-2'-O)-methyltransferase [Chlamydiia bacterium]